MCITDVCLCVAARKRRSLGVRMAALAVGFGGRHITLLDFDEVYSWAVVSLHTTNTDPTGGSWA